MQIDIIFYKNSYETSPCYFQLVAFLRLDLFLADASIPHPSHAFWGCPAGLSFRGTSDVIIYQRHMCDGWALN
jgi:hypothetical protein